MGRCIGFCIHCEKEVNCVITEHKSCSTVDGHLIWYKGKDCYCPICGTKIYVPEVDNLNAKELHNEFLKHNKKQVKLI